MKIEINILIPNDSFLIKIIIATHHPGPPHPDSKYFGQRHLPVGRVGWILIWTPPISPPPLRLRLKPTWKSPFPIPHFLSTFSFCPFSFVTKT